MVLMLRLNGSYITRNYQFDAYKLVVCYRQTIGFLSTNEPF